MYFYTYICFQQIDLHKLTGVNFISSHPITDHDGVTYNVGTSFSTGPKYVVVRIPPNVDDLGACESAYFN